MVSLLHQLCSARHLAATVLKAHPQLLLCSAGSPRSSSLPLLLLLLLLGGPQQQDHALVRAQASLQHLQLRQKLPARLAAPRAR